MFTTFDVTPEQMEAAIQQLFDAGIRTDKSNKEPPTLPEILRMAKMTKEDSKNNG